MRRGILGLLVLVLACVGAPARGEVSPGSTTGINGVLYDDCLNYPYRYALTVPEGAVTWRLDVTVLGPDGRTVGTDFVGTGEPTSHVRKLPFKLCTPPTHQYGRYTIRSEFGWTSDDDVPHTDVLTGSSFTLRKPRSLTTLTASTRRPAYGKRVRYRIRAYDENPTGFLPRAFAWVHLEKRSHGHWVRIRGSRAMTHSTGAVKVRVRYLKRHHRTLKVRAVTERTVKFTRSVSPVVRVW